MHIRNLTKILGCFLIAFFVLIGGLSLVQAEVIPESDQDRLTAPGDLLDSPFSDLIRRSFSEKTHYLNILETGNEALLARIHLIRKARHSILLQTFIWEGDECGRLMVYELVQAAERGVNVSIIVDELEQSRDPEVIAFLETFNPHFEIRFYNPLVKRVRAGTLSKFKGLFKLKKLNQRMHNKLIVVDNQIGITGGRNIGDEYFDRGVVRNFKDRDVLVVGPVVEDMTKSFFKYWNFSLTVTAGEMMDVQSVIRSGNYKRYSAKDAYKLGTTFEPLYACSQDPACIRKTFVDESLQADQVRFVSDRPGKNESKGLGGGGRMGEEIGTLLMSAEKEVIIQTPYLVLSRDMRVYFKNLRQQKPDLSFIVSTNSLAAADHDHAYAFFYKYKSIYINTLNWRMFELKKDPIDLDVMVPPLPNVERISAYKTIIHAKTVVVDGEVVYIGSFNLDPRAVNLNTEVGLIIKDKEVAQKTKEYLLSDIAPQNSWVTGKRLRIPIFSEISGGMRGLSRIIPFFDFWPVSYAASYELREDGEEMPFYDEDFRKNYKSVGPFPQVPFFFKEFKTRLMKTFLGPLEPMI